MVTREHLPQLGAEAVVQPRVKEGVTAGGAHGAQVAQQLDEQEAALVDEVNVDVSQHVEHVNRKPTRREDRHQERNQAEDLPLACSLSSRLALRPVARGHTLPQLHGDAEVRDEDGRQRQHVRDQQRAVCVSTSFLLLTKPEFLTDGEAFLLELHVVRVGDRRGDHPAGQQPDASEDRGARGHGDPLLHEVDGGVIPAIQEQWRVIMRVINASSTVMRQCVNECVLYYRRSLKLLKYTC